MLAVEAKDAMVSPRLTAELVPEGAGAIAGAPEPESIALWALTPRAEEETAASIVTKEPPAQRKFDTFNIGSSSRKGYEWETNNIAV